MTELQDTLDAIRGRVEQATEGPWVTQQGTPTMSGNTWTLRVQGMPGIRIGAHEYQHGAGNSEFISHARTDVPRLLAAVEAVLKLLKEPEEWRVYDTRDMGDAYAVDTVKEFIGDIRDAIADKLTGADDEQ